MLSQVKCEKYWPDLDLTQLFGDIIVENVNEKSFGSYKLRTLVVKDEKQTITVNHFHFLYWPDHGVPVATTNLVRYHETVSKLRANTPIVVHCSAGAGRTGAFIAYDFLCEEAKSLSSVDVYHCVMTLREQRVDMVQNCEQYILVHKLLLERYLFGKTEAAIDEITRDIPSETSLRKEFNNLSVVAPITHAKYGDQQKHRTLNRNQNIIPYERNRVTIVMRDTEAEVPYIIASILETYEPSTKLMVAQGPVKASIEHFWRAIFDNNVNTIVMLTKCVEGKKEQSVRYWPDEKGGSIVLKDMTVVFRSMDSSGQLITREFQITREDEEKIITQYQYIGWNSDGKPENASDILDLVENMHTHVHNSGGEMALVHCSDGAGRTGAFCAIVNMLQRLKCENKVDVFRTVKDLRDYRPGMVQTMEQYRFCYEAVSSYLTSFHLYSNLAAEKQENGEEESIYQNM